MNKAEALTLMQSRSLTTLATCDTQMAPIAPMQLRFSGYDPRAVGGRQTLKLELRGELALSIQQINFRFHSELFTPSNLEYTLLRTPSGLWPPLLLNFSSKQKEHGQYPLEAQLRYHDGLVMPHLWTCTTTLFLPPANASLSEIHQVFLARQKKFSVHAEDGAIAKLSGLQQASDLQHTNLDIAIYAKDAAIAQLDMTDSQSPRGENFEIGLSSIAWDEALFEVAVPSFQSLTGQRLPASQIIPAPATPTAKHKTAASLLTTSNSARTKNLPIIRLFAAEEWVLGRLTLGGSCVADILLSHPDPTLTKRISARHAQLRRTQVAVDARLASGAPTHVETYVETCVEIEDTSRYGLVVDGQILEKNQAKRLAKGMQIEVCASVRGIAQLRVAHILPHALILQRLRYGEVTELLYLITPESAPEAGRNYPSHTANFFHLHGQFFLHDSETGLDQALMPMEPPLSGYQYCECAYPDFL